MLPPVLWPVLRFEPRRHTRGMLLVWVLFAAVLSVWAVTAHASGNPILNLVSEPITIVSS